MLDRLDKSVGLHHFAGVVVHAGHVHGHLHLRGRGRHETQHHQQHRVGKKPGQSGEGSHLLSLDECTELAVATVCHV